MKHDGIAAAFLSPSHVEELRARMRARSADMNAHPQPMPVQMTKELEDIRKGCP